MNMKCSKCLLCAFLLAVAIQHFSSCCRGQSISIDCGNPTLIRSTRSGLRDRRRLSLVSSLIRSRFASSYRRVYSCWKAANVTELHSKTNSTMESMVAFSLDMASLRNITGARLTFHVEPSSIANPDIRNGSVVDAFQVQGTVESLVAVPVPKEENTSRHDDSQIIPVNFNAVDFLKDALQQRTNELEMPDEPSQEKMLVKFYVTVNCDCDRVSVPCTCPSLVEKEIHTPSLRVFYT